MKDIVVLVPGSFELQVITVVVGAVRLELTNLAVADFKSAAYACSATPPLFSQRVLTL